MFHNLKIKDFFSYYRGKKNPFSSSSNTSRKWALMAKEKDLFYFTSRGQSCWAGIGIADCVTRFKIHYLTFVCKVSL